MTTLACLAAILLVTGLKLASPALVRQMWAAGKYRSFAKSRSAKLDVLRDGNEALMHHKVIIVDRQTLISGSYNYSQNAEQNNNEAFLIIKGAPTVVSAFEDEYKRLNHAAKVNRPPPTKPKDAEHKTGEGP